MRLRLRLPTAVAAAVALGVVTAGATVAVRGVAPAAALRPAAGHRAAAPAAHPPVPHHAATVAAGLTPLPAWGNLRLALPWPQGTQSALAVASGMWLGSLGRPRPVPVASLAKVMTALVVLHDHPLAPGAQGPVLTVDATAVRDYLWYDTHDGSMIPVRLGERLTERQALLGMLLPSANNMAVLLARWDAGSVGAFVNRMNITARALGLARTWYTDPSGFSARTVSTAADQVRLAAVALRVPALAVLVATRTAVLPVAGLVVNVNGVLGQDGIVGLKTGSTDAAGACYLFAAVRPVQGRRETIVGAILGEQHPALLSVDFAAAQQLLQAAVSELRRAR